MDRMSQQIRRIEQIMFMLICFICLIRWPVRVS